MVGVRRGATSQGKRSRQARGARQAAVKVTTGGRRMRILLGTPARACHDRSAALPAKTAEKHPLPAVSRYAAGQAKDAPPTASWTAFSRRDDDHLLARAEHGSPVGTRRYLLRRRDCWEPVRLAARQHPDLAPLVAALFAFVTDGILVQDGEGPARPLLHHAFDQAWGLHAGGPRYCARHGIDPEGGPVPLVAYLVVPGIHIVAAELAGVRCAVAQRFGRHRPASRCRIGWSDIPAR